MSVSVASWPNEPQGTAVTGLGGVLPYTQLAPNKGTPRQPRCLSSMRIVPRMRAKFPPRLGEGSSDAPAYWLFCPTEGLIMQGLSSSCRDGEARRFR
jgi:hypothetical protein